MAFGIDDIVESALGPWGLVLGLGVTALVTRRERIIPALASGAAVGKSRIDAFGAASSAKTRAGVAKFAPAAALAGGGIAKAGQIANCARPSKIANAGQAILLGVTRSWSDLYEEAKAEFEASHPSATGAVWLNGERVDDIVQSSPAVRDEHGRFIKRTEG